MSMPLTFFMNALGKNSIFLSSMRLNKALDAQNRTAQVDSWTLMTMNLWSQASTIHRVMTLTPESCESVMCDGCVDIN